MKKYLPLILLGLGLIVAVVAFFVLRGRGGEAVEDEDAGAMIEVPLEDRPVASLTPSEDSQGCVELALVVEKIRIEAASMDYELLYKLPDGRTQGVPGTLDISGVDSVEKEGLLLGSESSGRRRCDEGVENGTLTLRFRNDKGRLLTRFTTDFSLQSGTDELVSVDGEFTAALDASSREYFVTMGTFGVPGDLPGALTSGPYGVFTSASRDLDGEVELSGNANRWTGSSWSSSFSEATGIFVGI